MRMVILGGGAIGASIASFAAARGAEVVVVERHAVGGAASGKAGGFLALDWCDGTPVEALARRSFALHADLGRDLSADWDYRRLDTYAAAVRRAGAQRPPALSWTAPEVVLSGRLGGAGTTAQVHPGGFTRGIMRLAEAHGAVLRLGEATGLLWRGERIAGVEVDGAPVEADAVVIAMGPWSVLAARWLPLPPVYGLKGHSVVFDTGGDVPPEALFLECEDASGNVLTPEVFPRADGTTYACAVSSSSPLPVDPRDVEPDPGAIDRLLDACSRISPALTRDRVRAAQACFRPVTRDGLPLIGALPGAPGGYVATGHGVWGILNAPATGEAMAELILDGAARAVDLGPFDPGRMAPLDRATVRRVLPTPLGVPLRT